MHNTAIRLFAKTYKLYTESPITTAKRNAIPMTPTWIAISTFLAVGMRA